MFVRLQREFVKGRVGSCIRQATFPIDRFYRGTYCHECGSVIMFFLRGKQILQKLCCIHIPTTGTTRVAGLGLRRGFSLAVEQLEFTELIIFIIQQAKGWVK